MLDWPRAMITLELIPHHWGKIFLCTGPSVLWILGFSSLAGGRGNYCFILCEHQALLPLIHSDVSFSSPSWSAHRQRLIFTQLNTWGDPLQISSVLSVQLSPVQYSALWTLATSVPWTFSFIYSTHRVHCTLLSSPSQYCGLKTLSNGKQGNYRAHLVLVSCLSGTTILCCLMPSVLKTTVPYIFFFFGGVGCFW